MNYRRFDNLMAVCGLAFCFLMTGCAFSDPVLIEGTHESEYELNLLEGRKPGGGDLFSEEDLRPVYDETLVTDIVFDDDDVSGILCSGPDESYVDIKTGSDGVKIFLMGSGTYRFFGDAENLQIEVDASKDGLVRIILAGVSICSDGEPAIYVNSADTVYLMTEAGTVNSISGTDMDSEAAGRNNAVIFSDDDLVIQGEGDLYIRSFRDNAIVCKNDFSFTGGNVRIDSADIGIEVKNSFRMAGGVLSIDAADDGIQVTNSDDEDKGYVYIGGGELTISCGDDAIHSERRFVMADGIYTVTGSREAIEAGYVNIGGGVLRLCSDDDGINASGKKIIVPYVRISGGDIYIDSAGDGIDSNGVLYMDGGMVFIEAPENSGDDPLDRDMGITYSGGCLIALMGEDSMESYAAGRIAERQEYTMDDVSGSDDSGNSGDFGGAESGCRTIEVLDQSGGVMAQYKPEDPFSKVIVYSDELTIEVR